MNTNFKFLIALLGILMLSAFDSTVLAQEEKSGEDSARLDAIEKRLETIETLLTSLNEKNATRSGMQEPSERPDRKFDFSKLRLLSPRTLDPEATGLAELDSDLDGLTDDEEALLGTDPENPDTDGDALLDGWEALGIPGVDLPALGANPLHKDIFVEMDFMVRDTASNGLGPNATVLDGIRHVFSAALVNNPDGVRGINIHLETGNEVPHDQLLNPAEVEFDAIKSVHFDSQRAPVYHYMVWADSYLSPSDGSTTSSGNAFDIPNSDFIVTLGAWNNGNGGTNFQKLGTFVHELGHNLGLRHGGNDHVGYKPNHVSIMNYSFQMSGIMVNGQRRYDYQWLPLPSLDERALLEPFGLGGDPRLSGVETKIRPESGPFRSVDATSSIDWDGDGTINANPVTTELNGDTMRATLWGTPDEWNNLVFNGGPIGSTNSITGGLRNMSLTRQLLPQPELTEEMNRLLNPDE